MARRPSLICYNDLNGAEMRDILVERFIAVLDEVPYFQKHLTLPRVKAVIKVELTCEAEDPNAVPNITLDETVEVRLPTAGTVGNVIQSFDLSSVVDSSPKGTPPDNVRLEHGIEPTQPSQTFDSRGQKLAIADVVPASPPPIISVPLTQMPESVRISDPANEQGVGMILDRSGNGVAYAGQQTRAGSVSVVQDPGPAGLANRDGGNVNNRFNHSLKRGSVSDIPFLKKPNK